ncbi:NAD-dependent succinate-semialdehyde dehydrogenase [Vibrio cholerae]
MENRLDPSEISFLLPDTDAGLAVHNPATGEPVGVVPVSTSQEIEQAIGRAHKAQPEWAALSAKARADRLLAWYALLLEHQEALATLMTLEQGKPLPEARGEVAYGASFIQWFAEEGKRAYGETIPAPSGDKRIVTIKQPVGVACAITPWNFPIAMITRKAAPALAAGCSFIVKPSELTPLSAFALAKLAYQAGIHPDVFQVVIGRSAPEVGERFTSSPLIRKLSFTGSTRVGKALLAQSAHDVKRTSMELGGNAPFIVFADADVDAAVDGAIASKFRNAGQTCVCANRFYVQRDIYDAFVAKFVAKVEALTVGNGLDEGVEIGPIITHEAKQKLFSLVEQAKAQGAVVANKARTLDGQFMAPVVLTNVEHTMALVQDEIFGPIAPIIAFDDEAQLIEQANDTPYGLAAYFYTQHIGRAWRVAEALDYGMVGINEGIISTEVAPFGGVKQSGIGREGAKQGLDEYLDIKYLCFGGV